MSCVLIIDDIPHIVRYGMHSDKPVDSEKCWIHFYRQGVCFVVHVEQGNVRGTKFAERWLPLLKSPGRQERTPTPAPAPATPQGGMRAWVKRWEDLCRLVIGTCLGTIERLVAVGDSAEAQRGGEQVERWKTLDGYLNTVRYELEVVAVGANAKRGPGVGESGERVEGKGEVDVVDGVMARVRKGPDRKPSYEFWPIALEEVEEVKTLLVSDLSADGGKLAIHHARDLEVLDAEKDWRAPPYKLRTKDGEVYYLVKCEKSAREARTGIVSNRSLDRINAHVRLHRVMNGSSDGMDAMVNVNIPRLRGVVLAGVEGAARGSGLGSGSGYGDGGGDAQHVARSSVDDSGSESAGAAASAKHTGVGLGEGVLIAGILLDYLPHAKTLRDFLAQVARGEPENETTVTATATATATVTEEMKQRWKEQVSAALRYLHGLRITIGGHALHGSGPEEDRMWYYVNQHTVMIAEGGSTTQQGRSSSGVDTDLDSGFEGPQRDAWLSLGAGCTFYAEKDKDAFDQARSMDWKGVERTFNI
ncbi:hypothetical protein H2202_002675 [Exophiala xenobiotica]|nr:hypothetical protein H2202_002675 [Exophiala xenobiotica]